MKLNYFTKRFPVIGRWMTTMLCLVAIVLVAFSNSAALAANLGDQIKGAADDVRSGSKELIRDSKHDVKKTANKNAAKVDRADDDGGAAERKAMRDRDRIEQRAEEHASRTETAVDKSMDAVKNAVDNIKDAFSK